MKYNRQTPCVYHKLGVVFHGIPKNASTSIKNSLYEAEWGYPFEGNKQWVHKGNEKGGSKYPDPSTINEDYKDFFHFTVVRNPYERFKSFYSDLFAKTTNLRTNVPPFYVDNNISLTPKPVDEVIEIVESFGDSVCDEHFASQSSFIYSDNCIFIKMEHINQGWKTVCDRIDVEYSELPVYNKSNNVVNLTEKQKQRIFKRYQKDFERFKYER